MNTTSDLLDEHVPNEVSTTSVEGNFGILLPVIFLERFAYYGFRSIVLVYALKAFNLGYSDTLDDYGNLAAVTYIMGFLGGVVGDFVLPRYKAMVVGSIVSVLGTLLCAFGDVNAFYIGCFVLSIGVGLLRTNILAYIASITPKDFFKLEKRYLTLYFIVNLGAAIGTLCLLVIGESFGFFWSFLVIAIAFGVNVLLLSVGDKKSISKNLQKDEVTGPQPSYLNILLLLIPIVGVAVFWSTYEQVSAAHWETKALLFRSFGVPEINAASVASIFLLIIAFPLLFLFKKIHSTTKIGIGLLLMSVYAIIVFSSTQFHLFESALMIFILATLFETVCELFVGPPMSAIIGLYTPKKMLGTVFGISIISSWIGLEIWEFIFGYEIGTVGWIVLIVLLLTFGILLFFLRNWMKSTKTE